MNPPFFETLVKELSNISELENLPEWIPCTDSDILRDFPTMTERRRWLRRAKAEITRREIQERVDEISEAWEADDEICLQLLMHAFPEDLLLRKTLTSSQRQMWLDKASLAACGRSNEIAAREPIIHCLRR